MLTEEDQGTSKIFACPQCPKVFATRSNLKRHMENPNIHNIPYVRSRDQKRWKGHSKKIISKEETTESNNDRMRKWRAENREKNRQNDLRCRVYRLARQKFGVNDSPEKQGFVREEIARRLGRRMMMERRDSNGDTSWTTPICNQMRILNPPYYTNSTTKMSDMIELPFYSVPQQKIELPSIDKFTRTSWSSSPPDFSSSNSSTLSSPVLPHLSPTTTALERRTSDISISSMNSTNEHILNRRRSSPITPIHQQDLVIINNKEAGDIEDDFCVLPSMHTFLQTHASSLQQQSQPYCMPNTSKSGIKYVESNNILDEFVGVVLNYVDKNNSTTTLAQ